MPTTARGVLLVGGTFDPPHIAHVDLPRSARDRLCGRGWWLVYVPAARSPHKADGPRVSDEDRVEMLRLAIRRVPRCAIWTDELDRPGPSYWVDTLRRAATIAPATPLRFVIGTDQAIAFHRWREPREILQLAEPLVMLRPPHRSPAGVIRAMRAASFWTQSELDLWRSWIDDDHVVRISATDIRAALSSPKPTAAQRRAIETQLAPTVRRYIARKELYSPEPF